MYASSKGIQVQFTVTIPAIEPQELQFDPDLQSGSGRTELGREGCGVVYAGHYQNQPVAIKTLHVTTCKVVKSLYADNQEKSFVHNRDLLKELYIIKNTRKESYHV